MNAWTIQIQGLCKCYGSQTVLRDLHMELAGGGVYCLMAPSGAGKTTLLRLLAGLEQPDQGNIRYLPVQVAQEGTGVDHVQEPDRETSDAPVQPPGRRTGDDSVRVSGGRTGNASVRTSAQMTFSFVFQEDRLCPGLGVEKNIELVRPMVTGQALREEICRLLPPESLSKPVSEFSGGMSRRAALLRAMLSPGEVLLMDEPFTGLDEDSRQAAYRYVLERRSGRTLLFTTHHEEEGQALGAVFCSLYDSAAKT